VLQGEVSPPNGNIIVRVFSAILAMIRFVAALVICLIALVLPYRARLLWYQFMAQLIHLPFRAFAVLARFIMAKTKTDNPFEE
jgi:hypothetical protein